MDWFGELVVWQQAVVVILLLAAAYFALRFALAALAFLVLACLAVFAVIIGVGVAAWEWYQERMSKVIPAHGFLQLTLSHGGGLFLLNISAIESVKPIKRAPGAVLDAESPRTFVMVTTRRSLQRRRRLRRHRQAAPRSVNGYQWQGEQVQELSAENYVEEMLKVVRDSMEDQLAAGAVVGLEPDRFGFVMVYGFLLQQRPILTMSYSHHGLPTADGLAHALMEMVHNKNGDRCALEETG